MSMIYKRGRNPAKHDLHTMRGAIAMHNALAALGTPPTVSDDYVSAVVSQYGVAGWRMYLNGPDPNAPGGVPTAGLGDCIAADSCHQIMLHTANAGKIVIPTDEDCLRSYEAVGGYIVGEASTDQGCDETSMCRYLRNTGIAGQKSAGSGMVDPANLAHIKWTIQIFGACRFGIICDEQMEEQFSSLEEWAIAADPNDPSAGGHDYLAVCYDANHLYGVTWGGGSWSRGLQPVAWPLVANPGWLDEAHAEAFPDFIRAGGTAPNGFPLAELLADLPKVTVA